MNPRRSVFLAYLAGLTLLAGCSLPAPFTPTDLPFPMPNQTLTALFATPQAGAETPLATPRLVTATPVAGEVTTVPPSPTLPLSSPTNLPTLTDVPASQTPIPTAVPTRLPTRTATTASQRGLVVEASRLTTTPVLDGGWTDLPTHEYPISYVVFGKNAWAGKDDLSASFRVGWNSTYLYLGVKVHDDIYAQHAAGAILYKGDSLDVMIDTDLSGDFYDQSADSDDYQLGISPGRPNTAGTKEAYLWQPGSVAGARTQVKIASTRSEADQLTRIEVAIPWSMLGVTPKAGMRLGFALSVSDNDSLTNDIQKSLISTSQFRLLYDPTTWGELDLK